MTSHYAILFSSFHKRPKSIASRCQIRDKLRGNDKLTQTGTQGVAVGVWNIHSQIVFDINCFGDTADVWVRWRLFVRLKKDENIASVSNRTKVSVYNGLKNTFKTKLLSELYNNCGLNSSDFYQKSLPILNLNTTNNHYHQQIFRPWILTELFKFSSHCYKSIQKQF